MTQKIALSWSGGKDSCLALHTLMEQGYEVVSLVTTVPKELGRTFAHGERTELIKLQGESLNIPVHFIECQFESYTENFFDSLKELKQTHGITGIAYGDLYLDEHRDWGEKVADQANLTAIYPLWMKKEDSLSALEKFVQSGYQAVVIRVREDVLDDTWLGKPLDEKFLEEIQLNTEVCPMGEAGEYHTFVYDGPLFTKRIELQEPSFIALETTKRLEFRHFQLIEK
ncbi:diphthine--ammonia ligase [Bacillus sp. 31A1R]|uniref:Diphthine--ammonia ligase n=1 Tax=Robertmurraya mangrovi TaxID=3098077 RepID=A0ABU5J106_9BACI|nr:diphthine--ammonia ligase [Bacillus sp. 31A1R]MDZ5473032.1 diphthine--ammonia ligase [Bacillus sp. 31A1R]